MSAASRSAARSVEDIQASVCPAFTVSPSLTRISSIRPPIGGLIWSRFCGSTVPVVETISLMSPISGRISSNAAAPLFGRQPRTAAATRTRAASPPIAIFRFFVIR